MGIFDSAKEKLGQLSKNEGTTDQGLDKASEAAKGRLEGHDEHIDKAREMADGRLGDERQPA
jgi:hypothetical protein